MSDVAAVPGPAPSVEGTLHEPRSSVTVTRNSRGYGWEVKMYSNDTDLTGILAALRDLTGQLERDYPAEK